MSIAEAVRNVMGSNGYHDAAKRPSWKGYVKVEPVTDPAGYTLTFKNRAGTTYAYSLNSGTGVWTAPGTPVPVDADLLAGILADDWITGKAADFDSAASGTGTW